MNRVRPPKPAPVYPVEFPDVLSRDALLALSDDKLAERLDVLHGDIDVVQQTSKDLSVRPWEDEICYTHRELGARIARRQAHEKYLAAMSTSAPVTKAPAAI